MTMTSVIGGQFYRYVGLPWLSSLQSDQHLGGAIAWSTQRTASGFGGRCACGAVGRVRIVEPRLDRIAMPIPAMSTMNSTPTTPCCASYRAIDRRRAPAARIWC